MRKLKIQIKNLNTVEQILELYNPNITDPLFGTKRMNSKSTEHFEEEIRFLHQRIDELTKEVTILSKSNIHSIKFGENDFDFNDNDSSSILNNNLHKTKSWKYSTVTDIAYLYSFPQVKIEKSKKIIIRTTNWS